MWAELNHYRILSRARKRLLLEAFLALLLAWIVMARLPLLKIQAWLGSPLQESPPVVLPEQVLIASNIGWAVTRVAHRGIREARCLAQAIAAGECFGVEALIQLSRLE